MNARIAPSSATRRGSGAEVVAWVACALLVGSVMVALFRYMYLGLLSFLLLPIVAICWSRAIVLSAPAREGGHRGVIVATLVMGTAVGGIVFAWLAGAVLGPAGIHD